MNNASIVFAIPTLFDNPSFTHKCVDSLHKILSNTAINYKICVIANKSSDKFRLAEFSCPVEKLSPNVNYSISKSLNLAIDSSQDFDYFCYLDEGIRFFRDFKIVDLLNLHIVDENIGVIGLRAHSAYNFYNSKYDSDGKFHNVLWSDGIQFIPMSLLKLVGGYDEVFFAECELQDLCYRLHIRGKKNLMFKTSCFKHAHKEGVHMPLISYLKLRFLRIKSLIIFCSRWSNFEANFNFQTVSNPYLYYISKDFEYMRGRCLELLNLPKIIFAKFSSIKTFFTASIFLRNPFYAFLLLIKKTPSKLFLGSYGDHQFFFRFSDWLAVKEVLIDGEYDYVKDLFPKKASISIVDLGANIGCFAFVCFNFYSHPLIYSVEASHETYNVLNANQKLIVSEDWNVYNNAIWHESDNYLSLLSTSSSMSTRVVSKLSGKQSVSDLNPITLDNFVKNVQRSDFNLIKIDIEGSEELVVPSAIDCITNFDVCIIEVHNDRFDASRVIDILLRSFTYHYTQIHRISNKPLIVLSHSKLFSSHLTTFTNN